MEKKERKRKKTLLSRERIKALHTHKSIDKKDINTPKPKPNAGSSRISPDTAVEREDSFTPNG